MKIEVFSDDESAARAAARFVAAEAAALSGFSDQSHMARTFKKVFGITPGQYCTMHMNTLRVGTRGPRYNS